MLWLPHRGRRPLRVDFERCYVTRQDGVAVLTLNHPETVNAASFAMMQGCLKAMDLIEGDPDLNALILTGAGRGFCSGANLTEPPPESADLGEVLERTYHPLLRRLRDSRLPIVTAVNGPAAGVGMSLALMVMTAVLTTYVMIGRNFTRSLGLTSMNQPSLESQARRTLAAFARDVRMASDISGTPSATSLTLTLPQASGTTTVAYSYDSTAGTLTRTPSGGTAQVLQSNITTANGNAGLVFRYYDVSGNPYDNGSSPYITVTTYPLGIKQVSLSFATQAGSTITGTLTQVYQTDSPRLAIRNKGLLP